MKIFFTGATGFLGNVVCRRLIQNGHEIYALIRETLSTRRMEDIVQNPLFHIVRPGHEVEIFTSTKLDAVVHIATAYGRDGESFPDLVKTNIEMPLQLLDYAMKTGVKCFINSDTFSELSTTTGPIKYYVQTKKTFLQNARERLKPDIKFVNMKIQQMYGPDDNATKFLPKLIDRFMTETGRIALSPGYQERDYVYVEDVAQAYISALNMIDRLGDYEEFNIGTGKTHTLRDLVKEIRHSIKHAPEAGFGDVPYNEGEVMKAVADTRNNALIGWQAKTCLSEGIAKTVAFYTQKK